MQEPDDLGELYAALASRLRRIVRFSISAPDTVIDDACQIAWSRLLRFWDGARPEAALPWLVTTATREALRLDQRSSRELSLDALVGSRLELARDSEAPPAPEEVAELRAQLNEIRTLPKRQQQLVWLQGMGLSYGEMAGYTGDSRRTVERQLMRAKRSLGIVG